MSIAEHKTPRRQVSASGGDEINCWLVTVLVGLWAPAGGSSI